MYSLVSASVLAIDLARHPHGTLVADTVDRVLTLSADQVADLAVLACRHADQRPAARLRLLAHCAAAPRMSTLMRGVAASVRHGPPSPAATRTIYEALTETMFGGYADIERLLRSELPLRAETLVPTGVQAALDAVLVAWAGAPDGAGVPADDLGLLDDPWRSLSPLPVCLPYAAYGGAAADLRALLEAVPRLDRSQWERLQGPPDIRLGWAEAMHAASRAAYQSGRLVAVARAQLAAARVVRLSAVSTSPGASTAMMTVSAAVQATCLGDVLPEDVGTALRRPWETALRGA